MPKEFKPGDLVMLKEHLLDGELYGSLQYSRLLYFEGVAKIISIDKRDNTCKLSVNKEYFYSLEMLEHPRKKATYKEMLENAKRNDIDIMSLYIAFETEDFISPSSKQFEKVCALVEETYTQNDITLLESIEAVKKLIKDRGVEGIEKYTTKDVYFYW